MYEAFYGLNEKPFNLTPDPRFLFLSEKHEEAFAHLLYGIKNRSGFIMVSGEIGTGKTTICRSLLKQLDSDTEVAFIFNPMLSPEELLGSINADFGLSSQAETVRGLVDELNGFLLERASKGKNCVLIIDEAQNLGVETLEQVRLLSNLETETEKLLQIVLIGQPELAEKLALPELRQLNQRITARYHLGTLNYTETVHYIAFRLGVAGGRKRVRFTRRAVRLIYRISKGTPRVINALCDRSLLIGYTKEASKITRQLVKQAAREVQGERPRRKWKPQLQRLIPASAFLFASAAVVLLIILLTSGPLPSLGGRGDVARLPGQGEVATTPAVTVNVASDAAPPVDEIGFEERPTIHSDSSAEETVDAVRQGLRLSQGALQGLQAPVANVAEAASRLPDDLDTIHVPRKFQPSMPEAPAKLVDPAEARVAKAPTLAPPAGQTSGAIEEADERTSGEHSRAIPDLLRTWNLAVLGDLPSSDSLTDLRAFAVSNGLTFSNLRLTLDQIVTINLPVLTRARGGAQAGWYAVLGFEGDRVRVTSNGASETMDLAQLNDMYSGEAIYLWPDPDANQPPLSVRSKGPRVRLLQDDLRTLGLFTQESTGVYDARTVDVVAKIQRAAGLHIDGIVGPQTRMVIASWLPSRDTPSLDAPAFSSAARARVLASPGMIIANLRAINARRAAREAARKAESEAASDRNLETAVHVQAENQTQPALSSESSGLDPLPQEPDTGLAESEVPVEGGPVSGSVLVESLEVQEYRPQLETDDRATQGSVTPSASPIVPIVPRDALQRER